MSRSSVFSSLASQEVTAAEFDVLDVTTGTAGATTFLRGDKQWAAAGSTDAGDLDTGTLPNARLADPVVIPSIVLTPGSAPSSPTEGALYYDSTADSLKVYTDSWALVGQTYSHPATGGDRTVEYTESGVTYRLHRFQSAGDFVTENALTVDFLLIGPGAGGGAGGGGGGGSGGSLWETGHPLAALTTYGVVIGSGGASATNGSANSTAFGFTAMLGGKGGSTDGVGSAGGSGGGGGADSTPPTAGGSTTQTLQGATAMYGNDGGTTTHALSPHGASGGGGGSAAGQGTQGTGLAGNGGAGISNFVNSSPAETTAFLYAALAGTNVSNVATATGSGGDYGPYSAGDLYIQAGGGGGCYLSTGSANPGEGGLGGGGNGSHTGAGTAAINYTGSGGGGGKYGQSGGSGGNGIFIVRYVV